VSEKTAQQLDPVGGVTARPLVVATSVIAVALAVGLSLATTDQVSNAAAAVAAVIVLALAGALFILAASPFRAPLRMSAHIAVCLLALAAIFLNAMSQWGSNTSQRDDWGPLSMAVLTIAFCSYRPVLELAACALVSSVIVAGIILVYPPRVDGLSTGLVVLVAIAPVLASGAAAAGFAAALLRILLDAQRNTPGRTTNAGDSIPMDLVEALPSPQAALLADRILPHLRAIRDDGQLTADRAATTQELSGQLRRLMVADAEQSWLTRAVATARDPDRLADRLEAPQRSLLRALFERLQTDDVFRPGTLTVAVTPDRGGVLIRVTAVLVTGTNPRTTIAPYVAVARGIFASSTDNIDAASVALSFSTTVR
jgi:hypothetical protein